MTASAAFVLSLVLAAQTADRSSDGKVDVPRCEVTLIREVEVPARQPGVLEQLQAQEGLSVKQGDLLAQIDTAEAELRLVVAQREFDAAAKQAEENVEAQAAAAAEAVAKAEYEDSQYVNRRSPGAVNKTELRRQELTAERAGLQVKVAVVDFDVAKLNSQVAKAKVDVVQHEITTRKIVAPFDGMIVDRYREAGEWVQAGDPVLKVIQMDRLRVQGFVKADQYAPHELEGRPVEIIINLPGGKQHKVTGAVGYVSQVVEASDEYRIWAEIENVAVEEREGRIFWLIGPGMLASMSIDMTSAPAAVATRPAR